MILDRKLNLEEHSIKKLELKQRDLLIPSNYSKKLHSAVYISKLNYTYQLYITTHEKLKKLNRINWENFTSLPIQVLHFKANI